MTRLLHGIACRTQINLVILIAFSALNNSFYLSSLPLRVGHVPSAIRHECFRTTVSFSFVFHGVCFPIPSEGANASLQQLRHAADPVFVEAREPAGNVRRFLAPKPVQCLCFDASVSSCMPMHGKTNSQLFIWSGSIPKVQVLKASLHLQLWN